MASRRRFGGDHGPVGGRAACIIGKRRRPGRGVDGRGALQRDFRKSFFDPVFPARFRGRRRGSGCRRASAQPGYSAPQRRFGKRPQFGFPRSLWRLVPMLFSAQRWRNWPIDLLIRLDFNPASLLLPPVAAFSMSALALESCLRHPPLWDAMARVKGALIFCSLAADR